MFLHKWALTTDVSFSPGAVLPHSLPGELRGRLQRPHSSWNWHEGRWCSDLMLAVTLGGWTWNSPFSQVAMNVYELSSAAGLPCEIDPALVVALSSQKSGKLFKTIWNGNAHHAILIPDAKVKFFFGININLANFFHSQRKIKWRNWKFFGFGPLRKCWYASGVSALDLLERRTSTFGLLLSSAFAPKYVVTKVWRRCAHTWKKLNRNSFSKVHFGARI